MRGRGTREEVTCGRSFRRRDPGNGPWDASDFRVPWRKRASVETNGEHANPPGGGARGARKERHAPRDMVLRLEVDGPRGETRQEERACAPLLCRVPASPRRCANFPQRFFSFYANVVPSGRPRSTLISPMTSSRAPRPTLSHSLMRTASCVSRALSATRAFSPRAPARRPPASRASSTAVAASMAATKRPYPIGTPGVPWTDDEKKQWRASVESPSRSYQEEVLAKIEALRGPNFDVQRYGSLPYDESDPERFPLFAVFTKAWDETRPSVLITGGVHGYETSGVQGALAFLNSPQCLNFAKVMNIAVAPCVSPWGYERVQRWNAEAVDPNRSFAKSAPPPAREAAALMRLVNELGVKSWLVHIDLHETTDSDESEFRPAKAARDGEDYEPDVVPDGFYCVADSKNPQPGFQKAIIDAVRLVTHIAPPDANGNIIGEKITQEGVIEYPLDDLMLCASMTGAKYTSTSEVYPDSPNASAAECNKAQVACVVGALEYVVEKEGLRR